MNEEKNYSAFKSKSGIKRILKAFQYALLGLRAAWKYEHAFRQELFFGMILLVVTCLTRTTSIEKLLLSGSIFLILIVELLNSSIEATVDRISIDPHVMSGRAKDLGSAAVLLSIINAGIIWITIFTP